MENYRHSELTGKIIGCAMKVHRIIGPGFPEIIYKRCLCIELKKAGLKYVSEAEMDIIYEGIKVGSRRVDLLVEDVVGVELKAVTEVEPLFYVQIINYLKLFKKEVGLLLNFGNISLQYRRFANSR
ncbi:MAG TPA: GxxExxY protein [Ferruginibacter sp.]|jgi:GxxExxY protein|nr:GxxExxY protein [Ferruginibacter sp.]